MEDILFCIIIVITPSRYVVPTIRDVIYVFVHVNSWGKTPIVSRVSSTHKSIIKMYFLVSQGNSALIGWRSRPHSKSENVNMKKYK